MKESFVKLHLSILIAGMTGIFGKLISLGEVMLVWYRMVLATLFFYVLISVTKKFYAIKGKECLRVGGVGMLLALHWIFFYGSIKASNVSIGVVCFSLAGFFTALLEPLINRRRISAREVLLSLITVGGIALIFHFDTRYRLGIGLGVVSSALAALFTILNKKVTGNHTSTTLLFYEMAGGLAGVTLILPFYFLFFPTGPLTPRAMDMVYLLLLASVCTVGLYILQIQVLRKISAFTVNLSYNLEPIYSILLAMAIFHEAKELHTSFYIGLALIVLSVVLQTAAVCFGSKKPRAVISPGVEC